MQADDMHNMICTVKMFVHMIYFTFFFQHLLENLFASWIFTVYILVLLTFSLFFFFVRTEGTYGRICPSKC